MKRVTKQTLTLVWTALVLLATGCASIEDQSQTQDALCIVKLKGFETGTLSEAALEEVQDDLHQRIGIQMLGCPNPDDRHVTVDYGPLDSTILGRTTCRMPDNVCSIHINPRLDPDASEGPEDRERRMDQLRTVLRHEFGHALGIQHVERRDAIMFAYQILPEQHTEPAMDRWATRMQDRHHEILSTINLGVKPALRTDLPR